MCLLLNKKGVNFDFINDFLHKLLVWVNSFKRQSGSSCDTTHHNISAYKVFLNKNVIPCSLTKSPRILTIHFSKKYFIRVAKLYIYIVLVNIRNSYVKILIVILSTLKLINIFFSGSYSTKQIMQNYITLVRQIRKILNFVF